MCQNAIDFTDMAYRIFPRSRFRSARAVEGDNTVHLISSAHLTRVGVFGGSSEHREIDARRAGASSVQRVHFHREAGKFVAARTEQYCQCTTHLLLALEVSR